MPQLAKVDERTHVNAMKAKTTDSMPNDDPFSSGSRSRGSSSRAKVIDQDGREIPQGPFRSNGSGFDASAFRTFQQGQGSFVSGFDFSAALRPLTREQRLAIADHVITNDGDLDSLQAQIEHVWADLQSRATPTK